MRLKKRSGKLYKNAQLRRHYLITFLFTMLFILPFIFGDTVLSDAETPLSMSGDLQGSIINKGENFNTYKNNDGTYSTIIHNRPINYFDGKEYQPIDTTIQPAEEGYEVVKGVYKAYFKDNMEVKIEKEGTYLSFKPISFGDKPVENVATDKNQIVYKNIAENVDLSYTYDNAELKEEFILHSLPSFKEIQFTIDTNGLIEKTSDLVKIRKDGQTMFYLPSLYAYGANNIKKKLSYKLENKVFTIELPVEWLKNATYPVRIDPTTKIDISAYGTVEYDDDESCADIAPTSSSTSAYRARSLLKFTLTSLPSCETVDITEAKVYLQVYDDSISAGECGTYSLKMTWKEDDSWSCSSLSWSDASYHSDVLDTVCAYETDTWYDWDVYVPGKVDIEDDFEENCDDEISFVIGFTNENADPTEQVEFYTNAYMDVTYDVSNTAPIWSQPIANISVEEDSGISTVDSNLSVTGNGLCTDADGDALTYSVVAETASEVDISLVNNDHLRATPAGNFSGVSVYRIRCSDGTDYADIDAKVTVNSIDDTPNFDVATYDDSSAESPTTFGENVTFTASISDPDVDDQIALLICDDSGISGTSCAESQYCRDPVSGFKAEGSVSCKNETGWTSEESYSWASFALDDGNNVRTGATGTFYMNIPGDYPLSPRMYVNDVLVWDYSGYFMTTETTNNFAEEINDYLSSCTPVDGYCDVPVVLHSDSVGILKVDDINVYMNVTEYTWDTSSLPEGTQYRVRVKSTDGELNSTWDESDADFEISHQQIDYGNKTFPVKDGFGDSVAAFYDNGNLELAGTCSVSTCDDISSALFVIKDSGDSAVAYIDTSGNLCIETGDCSGQSGSCVAPDDAFVVRNSLDVDLAYIDSTGDLCLTGSLVENGSP